MSTTTETKAEQAAEQQEGFDLLAFWLLHKNMILLCAAVVALGLASYGTFAFVAHQREASAARMFAETKSAAEMDAVAEKHPRSMAAANALLLLAADHRASGRHDASLAALDRFASDFPDHPLAAGALLSRGATLEAAGRREEALAAYGEAASNQGSYAAPAAKLAKAALLAGSGKSDEARQTLEDLIAGEAGGPFAQEARRMLQLLRRM